MTSLGLNESSSRIRVLVADLPGVLLELVVEIVGQQADMTLVGVTHGWLELLSAAGDDVDVLIIGAPEVHPLPAVCSHLFGEYPDLRIVVLAAGGEQAAMYWLGLRKRQLRAVSTQTLLTNIRRAYRINPAS